MSKHDAAFDPVRFEAMIARWKAAQISPDDFDELSEILRSNDEARHQLLLNMQIEAWLVDKYVSLREVESLFERSPEGQMLPQANILRWELEYGNDEAFNAVFPHVEHVERHAQCWIHRYPQVRAYVLMTFPTLVEAEEVLNRIAKEIINHYDAGESAASLSRRIVQYTEQFASLQLASDARRPGSAARFARLRFANSSITETIELYEAIEATIPLDVSPRAIDLLCMRYLHGLSPQQIANRLGASLPSVYQQLANVRLDLWKRIPHPQTAQPIDDMRHLMLASVLLDAESMDGKSLQQLERWLEADQRHREQFASLAMLHEALHRQLSGVRLMNALSSRSDEPFTRAVEQALRGIEDYSPTVRLQPAKSSKGRLWAPALCVAMLLLIAASYLLLHGQTNPSHPEVAKVEPTDSNPAPAPETPSLPALPEQPRELAATITETIDINSEKYPGFAIDGEFEEGSRLAFDEGILQLRTTSGNLLVLEGPVDATLVKADRIELHQGRIAALNNTNGRQLVVETPTTTVVDLGTEFGVLAGEQTTSVAVYEGAVEVQSEAAAGQPTQVDAGYQVVVDPQAASPPEPAPLIHDRDFVRPGEVELRKAAKQGSPEAVTAVAFFQLLRTEGLLAYQGFNVPADLSKYATGFGPPPIRTTGDIRFPEDLRTNPASRGQSTSLRLVDESACFLELDVSERSALARLGLTDDEGMVGRKPGELWLSWILKVALTEEPQSSWAGLSLMNGDEGGAAGKGEPLFLGLPSNLDVAGLHAYQKDVRTNWQSKLDIDPNAPGEQELKLDGGVHRWIVHLSLTGSKAVARVWCDVSPADADKSPPHATQEIDDFSFDRLRLATAFNQEESYADFDQIILTSSHGALVEAIRILEGP